MKESATPTCLVCSAGLEIRPARGRKSGKPFIMLKCPTDGRHFRGFITDKTYVVQVFSRIRTAAEEG